MADKKALFRAKLAKRNEKRIENPLVRYNEHDQPVCRVCDVLLKSETDWTVHQASRKHNTAINNLKAKSTTLKQTNNVNTELPKDSHRVKPENHDEFLNKRAEVSTGLSKPRQASSLPPNFFDSKETKKQKSGIPVWRQVRFHPLQGWIGKSALYLHKTTSTHLLYSVKYHIESRDHGTQNTEAIAQAKESLPPIPRGKVDINNVNIDGRSSESGLSKEQISKQTLGSETRKAKGLIPEGFYDNKDADLRARGITPVKPDVKDEYKEFEKLIQEDLKEVDKRLEEEEYDAADMIEEEETVEQRAYRERVEMLKKKKMELKARKSTIRSKASLPITKEESTSDEESSSDDSNENLTVDWRAKHL